MNAQAISGPRSGSGSTVRILRPSGSRVWTLTYPSGALRGVPPVLAFSVQPLMTSVARLRE
ncbi:MAG: hypothetical protein LBD51_09295 [Bifidobacteriaceae bacterium]|nr:hypothetical protein [Bifidobacteriaceae bacterium]